MADIGFIGLGTMGQPMTKNLLKAGHRLTFFARREEVAAEFTALGAARGRTPADVTRASDFVITIVTADAQLGEVVLARDGVADGAAAGKTLIDMSTVSPDTERRLAAELSPRGMRLVDAPVSGGPWGAAAATLSIMCGAADDDYARCQPVLSAMGDKLFHCGPVGAGQTVKLVNQMMGGSIMALAGEGLAMAKAAGVDLAQLADVVSVSSGASSVFEARVRKFVLAGMYTPGFMTELMMKDVGLAVELARSLKVPTPVAAAALRQYTAAVSMGHARDDFAAVVKVNEAAAGVRLSDKK